MENYVTVENADKPKGPIPGSIIGSGMVLTQSDIGVKVLQLKIGAVLIQQESLSLLTSMLMSYPKNMKLDIVVSNGSFAPGAIASSAIRQRAITLYSILKGAPCSKDIKVLVTGRLTGVGGIPLLALNKSQVQCGGLGAIMISGWGNSVTEGDKNDYDRYDQDWFTRVIESLPQKGWCSAERAKTIIDETNPLILK